MLEDQGVLKQVGAERLPASSTPSATKCWRTLAKLKPLHAIPAFLEETEAIQPFQARLREARTGERASASVSKTSKAKRER